MSYVEGSNNISINILDRTFAIIGPGDIRTCLGVTYTEVLNDAGTWSARFPANDPVVDRVQIKRHFLDIYVDSVWFCRGLVEQWDWQVGSDGQVNLVLSGRDLLAELDETTIDFFLFSDDPLSVLPTAFAPEFIFNKYNEVVTGFSGSIFTWFIKPAGQTLSEVYGQTTGETCLSALRRIAEQTGESFRLRRPVETLWLGETVLDSARAVEWLQTATPFSGVRAEAGGGEAIAMEGNEHICFLKNLNERRDASRMLTKIIPYGSGLGETRLDIQAHQRGGSLPPGYSYSAFDFSITSDTALAYVGKVISRHVNFKDIRPLFNTDADIQYAKNYLFDAALAYLRRNDDINDMLEYDLEVAALPAHVQVGMTIRVLWQDGVNNISQYLVILGLRKTLGSDGAVTYSLTVATRNQWRFRETNNIVAQMEQGEIFSAHPQIDATAYWMPFKEIVGDNQTDHMAEFPFWLSAEVVTIRQVLFRFRVDAVLATYKVFDYEQPETALNVAADTGTSGSPFTFGSSLTVTGNQDTEMAAASPNATDSGGGGGTGSALIQVDTDTGGSGAATGGTAAGNTGNNNVATFPHTHAVTVTHSHTQTTHTHRTVSHEHTHLGATHTHAHSATHTHAHTHGHGMEHQHGMTHTHTSPQHTHGLPALVETTVVELVAPSLTYVIDELQYSVNGGAWQELDTAIPVAGGYSELDITALVQNPAGLKRPYQEYNIVQVRRGDAAAMGKAAQIRAQIGVRATIQSIVLY